MSTKYKNIFNSFDKGYIDNDTTGIKFKERKLENNLTRALFSVIENLENKTKKLLLKELFEMIKINVEINNNPKLTLLKKIDQEKFNKQVYLVIITGYGSEDNKEKMPITGDVIPDGWIEFDNLIVCLESKILSFPSDNQINGYEYKYKLKYSKGHILFWENIVNLCNTIIKKTENLKDKFLLNQLSDFLSDEGFGKLMIDKYNELKEIKELDEELIQDFDYFKVQLKKLLYSFNKDDDLSKYSWNVRSDNKFMEFDLISKEVLGGISLNVFFIDNSLKVSLYGYNQAGFEFLRNKSKKLSDNFKVSYILIHRDGKPIRGEKNCTALYFDNFKDMEIKYNDLKIKYKGIRISVYNEYDSNSPIWNKDYKEQIEIIKNNLLEYLRFLNT